jgi:histone-lysine N-methyltransferase SETD3
MKASILWNMDRLGDTVRLLEEHKALLKEKFEEYKKKYQEEYGLIFGEETAIKIENFTKWMRDNGAKFNKIRMRYYAPDYRGVHSYEPIHASEEFLWVPKKLIITSQMGKETAIGQKIRKSGVKVSWDYLLYITLFLLIQQKDTNSFWKPYMDVYPRSTGNFPMFFTKEEQDLLEGTPMKSHIPRELQEIREEYNAIVQAVPEFGQFSFEDYAKNKTLTISRIFFVKIHGENERIMVPLADMFNHHYEKVGQTYWQFKDAQDAFIVHAQKDIPLGDAICENYGQKPNYRFLFYYGFLIEANRKNAVYIKLYLNKEDPLVKIKEKMIGVSSANSIKTFKYFEIFGENEKSNNKLMGYLRFIEYEEDLNLLCSFLKPAVENFKTCTQTKRKIKVPHLSIACEKKALKKMKEIAEKCLKKYPQSYEEDMKILNEQKDLSFNIRNCIVYRAGEKKVFLTANKV